MAGAREKFDGPLDDEQTLDTPAIEPAEAQVQQQPETGCDIVLLISKILAVASLLCCLILPIWVYLSGPDVCEQNFATFKSVLIWPTLIYFITGTIWAVKRNKA